ncbi:MAG: biotin transporter BioY [Pseudomonadota bacterium]
MSFALPTSPVPQSLQTFALFLVAMLGGVRVGVAAVIGYCIIGAAGAPVFADGAAGWQHASGASAGYLLGFIASAAMVGLAADRGHCNSIIGAFTWGLLGHAVVLFVGWIGLLRYVGGIEAWQRGVSPFGDGAVAKSLILALVVPLLLLVVSRRRRAASSESGYDE